LKKRTKKLLRRGAAICLMLAGGAAFGGSYRTQGQCGGFPRVALSTAPGICAGLVAEHLGFARGVAVIGDTIYVLDMGGWRPQHGRLLRLGHGGHEAPETLRSFLDQPSALIAAADGTLYAGLLDRVMRIDPRATPPTFTDIVTGLPGTGRHPLTALALAPDGTLYVNVGSATDHCEAADGTPPDPAKPCPETSTTPPRAAILRIPPAPRPVAWEKAQVYATGLRNSPALAVLPDGALAAGVNARDFIDLADPHLSDEKLPHDTFEVITPGATYGWPYCFDENLPSPEYKHHDCRVFHTPTLLLPPHAAPVGMLVYRGAALAGLSGRLILTLHGYRTAGHRLVSLPIPPAGAPTELIWNWQENPGQNPQGAPTGLAEMEDGSLLVTEDHHGTLLRLAAAGR